MGDNTLYYLVGQQLSSFVQIVRDYADINIPKEIHNFVGIANGAFLINLLREVGSKNWIVLSPICQQVIHYSQEQMDDYFTDLYSEDKKLMGVIENRLNNSPLLVAKKYIVHDIFSGIENGYYSIASIALATLFEYVLAEKTELYGPAFANKVNTFINRIGPHHIDKEFLYCYGLVPFLERFSENTDFEKEEPIFLNRHWICHGRMMRELRPKDFYQLLAAFYALISIAEWE